MNKLPNFERDSFMNVCDDLERKKQENKPRVLLVEDVPTLQTVHTFFLESMGYEVIVAETGFKAMSLCQIPFDLILMDIGLPDIDGITVTQMIRQGANPNQTIPIVALTTDDSEDTQQRCKDIGMNDFARKPISFEESQKVTATWITKKSVFDTLN